MDQKAPSKLVEKPVPLTVKKIEKLDLDWLVREDVQIIFLLLHKRLDFKQKIDCLNSKEIILSFPLSMFVFVFEKKKLYRG